MAVRSTLAKTFGIELVAIMSLIPASLNFSIAFSSSRA